MRNDSREFPAAGHAIGRRVWQARARLWLSLGLLLLIWLVVLPWLSRQPAVSRWSTFLDARGVNPNAKFFTDQPAGFVNSRRVMEQARADQGAFWDPGRGQAKQRADEVPDQPQRTQGFTEKHGEFSNADTR